MKYLKKFSKDTDYQAFINGGGGVSLPNVSYTADESKIYYNPIVYTIEYTSTNGNIVEPDFTSTAPFLDVDGNSISIISNTYENGKGIIKLEKECYQIGQDAFQYCYHLNSIAIPDSVTTIGKGAFFSCSLTGITIPDTVTTIGQGAFRSCRNLTTVSLGNGITSIDITIFRYCSSLTVITIPNSVTSIGERAFSDCSKLLTINVLSENPPTLGSNTFYGIPSDAKIYVPSASLDGYKSADGWSTYADKIQAIE